MKIGTTAATMQQVAPPRCVIAVQRYRVVREQPVSAQRRNSRRSRASRPDRSIVGLNMSPSERVSGAHCTPFTLNRAASVS